MSYIHLVLQLSLIPQVFSVKFPFMVYIIIYFGTSTHQSYNYKTELVKSVSSVIVKTICYEICNFGLLPEQFFFSFSKLYNFYNVSTFQRPSSMTSKSTRWQLYSSHCKIISKVSALTTTNTPSLRYLKETRKKNVFCSKCNRFSQALWIIILWANSGELSPFY